MLNNSVLKKIVLVLSLFFILLIQNGEASASSLPDGINIVDNTGNGADASGNYFIEKNDIKPGDKFSRTLTISNYPVSEEEKNTSYNISIKMKPINQEGKADLFNNVNLKLISDGKEIFDGNIIGIDSSGNNYQENPLFVVKVSPGEAKGLVAEFTASDSLPTDYWVEETSFADFAWQFLAVDEVVPVPSSSSEVPASSDSTPASELPITKGSSSSSTTALRLPQTGEEWAVTLLGLAVGIIVITFVLVIVKKMRDNKEE